MRNRHQYFQLGSQLFWERLKLQFSRYIFPAISYYHLHFYMLVWPPCRSGGGYARFNKIQHYLVLIMFELFKILKFLLGYAWCIQDSLAYKQQYINALAVKPVKTGGYHGMQTFYHAWLLNIIHRPPLTHRPSLVVRHPAPATICLSPITLRLVPFPRHPSSIRLVWPYKVCLDAFYISDVRYLFMQSQCIVATFTFLWLPDPSNPLIMP